VGSPQRAADGGRGEAAGGCRRGDGGDGALLVHHCGGLRREDRAVCPFSVLFCSVPGIAHASDSSARDKRGGLDAEVLVGKFLVASLLGFRGEASRPECSPSLSLDHIVGTCEDYFKLLGKF